MNKSGPSFFYVLTGAAIASLAGIFFLCRSHLSGLSNQAVVSQEQIADLPKKAPQSQQTEAQTPNLLAPNTQVQPQDTPAITDFSDMSLPNEDIILEASAQQVSPGDTVHIRARAKNGQVLTEVGFVPVGDGTAISSDNYQLDADGLGFKVTIPADFTGVQEFGAVGLINGAVAVSNRLAIVSSPEPNQPIAYISFYGFNGPTASFLQGAEIPLMVRGCNGSGQCYDISHHRLGTTYSVSDPTIGKISPDGMFAALSPGVVTVTAYYKHFSANMEITVRPEMTLP